MKGADAQGNAKTIEVYAGKPMFKARLALGNLATDKSLPILPHTKK